MEDGYAGRTMKKKKKSVTQSSYISLVCLSYDETDADLNCQIDQSNS